MYPRLKPILQLIITSLVLLSCLNLLWLESFNLYNFIAIDSIRAKNHILGSCVYTLPYNWFKKLSIPKEVPRSKSSRIPTAYFGYAQDTEYGFLQNNCYINVNLDICNAITNKNVKGTHNVKTIVLALLSSITNFQVRQAIRNTYGSIFSYSNTRFILVFFIGRINAQYHNVSQQQIDDEFYRYHDIIQEDVGDSYNDLSFKALATFKWFSYFCGDADYFVRATDDIFINMVVLHEKLKFATSVGYSSGHIWNAGGVINEKGHKYLYRVIGNISIPWIGYYPPFYAGSFILYSADVAKALYMMSRRTPLFFPDDTYLAVMMEKLGLTQLNSDILAGGSMFDGIVDRAFYHFNTGKNVSGQIYNAWQEFKTIHNVALDSQKRI